MPYPVSLNAAGLHPFQASIVGPLLNVSLVFEIRTVEKGTRTTSSYPHLDQQPRTQPTSSSTRPYRSLCHSFSTTVVQLAAMRSPAIVFSVVAVATLSPTVLGSPLPTHSFVPTTVDHRRSTAIAARGLGFLNDIFPRTDAAPKPQPKVAEIMGLPIPYAYLSYTK